MTNGEEGRPLPVILARGLLRLRAREREQCRERERERAPPIIYYSGVSVTMTPDR